MRAVNQAAGRVIRHKYDYGCVILCDKRYKNYKDKLSLWLQDNLKD